MQSISHSELKNSCNADFFFCFLAETPAEDSPRSCFRRLDAKFLLVLLVVGCFGFAAVALGVAIGLLGFACVDDFAGEATGATG